MRLFAMQKRQFAGFYLLFAILLSLSIAIGFIGKNISKGIKNINY